MDFSMVKIYSATVEQCQKSQENYLAYKFEGVGFKEYNVSKLYKL